MNSLGLWVASVFLSGIEFTDGLTSVLVAGLVLALVNAVLKPMVILLSLPFILLSLGLVVLFINGLMVGIADLLYSGLQVDGYLMAILAGIVIGLVNYLVTITLEGYRKNKE